jgi:hypothetical protein
MKDLVLIVKAFTAVCKNDATCRRFSLNQELMETVKIWVPPDCKACYTSLRDMLSI